MGKDAMVHFDFADHLRNFLGLGVNRSGTWRRKK